MAGKASVSSTPPADTAVATPNTPRGKTTTTVLPATYVRDRQTGEIKMSFGEGFDAARSDRTHRTRAAVDSGADTHMTPSRMTKMREMGRDLDRNSGIVHGTLDRFSSHVVGSTLIFRPTTSDKDWNKRAKEWFTARSGVNSDVRGLFDLHEQCKHVMRSIGTDGEQLKIYLKDFQLQSIEAHQIGTPFDVMGADDRVFSGVTLNAARKPLGFWVSKDTINGYIESTKSARFIRAADTQWPAYRTRVTQTRGIPLIGSSLANFDRLDAYIDNEMLAAQIDACLTFWISQKTTDWEGAGILPPGQTEQTVTASDGTSTLERLQTVKPGTIMPLQDGEQVQQFGGARPGQQFEPFIIAGMRIFGANIGFPLELLLLDFSKTNYSSARAAILEAHKFTFEGWQKWLEKSFVTPVYHRWVAQAMAIGELPFNPEWQKIQWQWPTYPYIDPLKAALAIREMIAGGWHTITAEVERNGRNIEEVVTERSAEVEMFRKAKISTTTLEGVTVPGKYDPYKVLEGDNADVTLTDTDTTDTGANE